MIRAVRKALINLGTRWKGVEDLDEASTSARQEVQDRHHETHEQKIKHAYDELSSSLLNRCFHFYVERDPAAKVSFIIGKYVGCEGHTEVPEMSVTTYVTEKGYNGMLVKTVKPGKVDFLQYSTETASEMVRKIVDYVKLLTGNDLKRVRIN